MEPAVCSPATQFDTLFYTAAVVVLVLCTIVAVLSICLLLVVFAAAAAASAYFRQEKPDTQTVVSLDDPARNLERAGHSAEPPHQLEKPRPVQRQSLQKPELAPGDECQDVTSSHQFYKRADAKFRTSYSPSLSLKGILEVIALSGCTGRQGVFSCRIFPTAQATCIPRQLHFASRNCSLSSFPGMNSKSFISVFRSEQTNRCNCLSRYCCLADNRNSADSSEPPSLAKMEASSHHPASGSTEVVQISRHACAVCVPVTVLRFLSVSSSWSLFPHEKHHPP